MNDSKSQLPFQAYQQYRNFFRALQNSRLEATNGPLDSNLHDLLCQ
jgi:hypothetical protein